MLKRFFAPLVVLAILSLTACSSPQVNREAALAPSVAFEARPQPSASESPYLSVEDSEQAVQGIIAKDLSVCFETLSREYEVTDLKERNSAQRVTAGNGWCVPEQSYLFGLLFRVQAQQGHVLDFNLYNPGIGQPSVNVRDRTEGDEIVWQKQFSVGQKETCYVAGRTYEIERLPDTDRKKFLITLTS